jgi:predicted amino acid-binding ACT domain protein
MSALITTFFQKYLALLIRNYDPKQLKSELLSGKLALQGDLEFNRLVLQYFLGIHRMLVRDARASSVSVNIPYTSLSSKPATVELSTLRLILEEPERLGVPPTIAAFVATNQMYGKGGSSGSTGGSGVDGASAAPPPPEYKRGTLMQNAVENVTVVAKKCTVLVRFRGASPTARSCALRVDVGRLVLEACEGTTWKVRPIDELVAASKKLKHPKLHKLLHLQGLSVRLVRPGAHGGGGSTSGHAPPDPVYILENVSLTARLTIELDGATGIPRSSSVALDMDRLCLRFGRDSEEWGAFLQFIEAISHCMYRPYSAPVPEASTAGGIDPIWADDILSLTGRFELVNMAPVPPPTAFTLQLAVNIRVVLIEWDTDADKDGESGFVLQTNDVGVTALIESFELPPKRKTAAGSPSAKSPPARRGGSEIRSRPSSVTLRDSAPERRHSQGQLPSLSGSAKDVKAAAAAAGSRLSSMFRPAGDSLASGSPPSPSLLQPSSGGLVEGGVPVRTTYGTSAGRSGSPVAEPVSPRRRPHSRSLRSSADYASPASTRSTPVLPSPYGKVHASTPLLPRATAPPVDITPPVVPARYTVGVRLGVASMRDAVPVRHSDAYIFQPLAAPARGKAMVEVAVNFADDGEGKVRLRVGVAMCPVDVAFSPKQLDRLAKSLAPRPMCMPLTYPPFDYVNFEKLRVSLKVQALEVRLRPSLGPTARARASELYSPEYLEDPYDELAFKTAPTLLVQCDDGLAINLVDEAGALNVSVRAPEVGAKVLLPPTAAPPSAVAQSPGNEESPQIVLLLPASITVDASLGNWRHVLNALDGVESEELAAVEPLPAIVNWRLAGRISKLVTIVDDDTIEYVLRWVQYHEYPPPPPLLCSPEAKAADDALPHLLYNLPGVDLAMRADLSLEALDLLLAAGADNAELQPLRSLTLKSTPLQLEVAVPPAVAAASAPNTRLLSVSLQSKQTELKADMVAPPSAVSSISVAPVARPVVDGGMFAEGTGGDERAALLAVASEHCGSLGVRVRLDTAGTIQNVWIRVEGSNVDIVAPVLDATPPDAHPPSPLTPEQALEQVWLGLPLSSPALAADTVSVRLLDSRVRMHRPDMVASVFEVALGTSAPTVRSASSGSSTGSSGGGSRQRASSASTRDLVSSVASVMRLEAAAREQQLQNQVERLSNELASSRAALEEARGTLDEVAKERTALAKRLRQSQASAAAAAATSSSSSAASMKGVVEGLSRQLAEHGAEMEALRERQGALEDRLSAEMAARAAAEAEADAAMRTAVDAKKAWQAVAQVFRMREAAVEVITARNRGRSWSHGHTSDRSSRGDEGGGDVRRRRNSLH